MKFRLISSRTILVSACGQYSRVVFPDSTNSGTTNIVVPAGRVAEIVSFKTVPQVSLKALPAVSFGMRSE